MVLARVMIAVMDMTTLLVGALALVTLLALAGWVRALVRGGEPEAGSRPARRRSGRATQAARKARGGRRISVRVVEGGAAGPSARVEDGPVLVSLRGVARHYADADGAVVKAVEHADLDVREGELLALVGPSGLGKSTILNLMGGIDVPTHGTVSYRGAPLPTAEGDELRRFRASQVCFVFQDLNLVTHLTAEENAALPLLCRGEKRQVALGQAREHLQELGLGELLHRRPAQLSGGQRQRVAIARAFTSHAPLLLADEPTGSLDPETAEGVMEAFVSRARDEGRTVILVTHNHDMARRCCDRVVECTRDGLRELPPVPALSTGVRRAELAS